MTTGLRAAAPALGAALLFGASTPFAKALLGDVSPLLLAGLLYLGSGLGLGALVALRRGWRASGAAPSGQRDAPAAIPPADRAWLLGAIVFGGVLGPALLMSGLASTPAASASLLLNLEGVFTALIAWLVFRENADARIVAGMALIVAGGVLLSAAPGAGLPTPGALLVVGACACWAIDNNLTRKVSAHDAMVVAGLKGLVAGVCNVALAAVSGSAWPSAGPIAAALLLGFAGYGVSLALFVVALRTLGTARTGAYFSVAPLFGVAIAFAIWPAVPAWSFWAAAAMMATGVWLHLRERHVHAHAHEPMEHEHPHVHGIDGIGDDGHHAHAHEPPVAPGTRHTHRHVHAPLVHAHAHHPDIHHRHGHRPPGS